jgi:hypothetical protein
MKKTLYILTILLLFSSLPACRHSQNREVNEVTEEPSQRCPDTSQEDDINPQEMFACRNIVEAARLGDVEKVRYFLAAGSDVNGQYGNDVTALYWAAETGNLELAGILVESGANVNVSGGFPFKLITNRAGGTSEDSADDIIPKSQDGSEYTPDDIGGFYGLHDTGGLLKNLRVTPLHKAAEGGHQEVAQLLIDAGCKVNPKDNRGRTPLDLAQNEKMKVLLRSHGAVSGNELKQGKEK